MAYTLIQGRFQIHYPDAPRSGPQPDGDTLRFEPDQPALVEALRRRGRGANFNARGFISVRFEAIDALETHFSGSHQSHVPALAARDAMLAAAGYTTVEFHADAQTVARAEPLAPRGYLLARTLDPHGRVVAFVFAGEAAEADGAQLCLRPERARQSVNAQLIDAGLVYPSFYDTLPTDLREALAAVAVAARAAGRGLWPDAEATPARPARIASAAAVREGVIFPKLFRRLTDYFATGATRLAGFDAWLRAVPGERDDQIVFPPLQFGHLHDLVRIEGDSLRLTRQPEEFVIIDSPETWRSALEEPGCGPGQAPAVAPGDLLIVAALPDPVGADLGAETVTLLNTRAAPLDLAGLRLRDDDGGAGMPLAGVLAAGETLRVTLDARVRLGNQGDVIQLVAADGQVLDSVSYTADEIASGRTRIFGRSQ